MSDSINLWAFREPWIEGRDLTGYDVEALDGSIGTVDASSTEADNAHIVVDTGFWIFGKRRLIPAGAVTAIDDEHQKVSIALTKDQVKGAPDFDPGPLERPDPIYRSEYNEYYGPHGW